MGDTDTASQIRTIRSALLGILSEFDRVCSQNGLHYVATHGTLLGAVRDGGFTPGDDDLDVVMPRNDYDRLVALGKSGAFAKPFFLQTPENDPLCFYGGYAKLRDSSTSAIEQGYENRPSNQGMWMDIMPLDNCPLDYKAVQRQQRVVRFWQRVLYAQTYGLDMNKLWDADPAHISAYFIVAKHISRKKACKSLRKNCMSAKPTGLLTVFSKNYQRQPNTLRYNVEDVAEAIRVPFESITVPIPNNAEDWLLMHYGDSWTEASTNTAGLPYHNVVLDPNTPYELLIERIPSE